MHGSSLTKTALLLAFSLSGSAALAASASPLSPLAGTWSGGGVLRTSDGQEEPLRCRASYDVRDRGSEAYLNLRCASASYNFNLASQVAYSGGMISGAWTESSRNASGTIVGRTNGRRILATARGNNFSAGLTLTTRGNRQTVSIRPYQSSVSMVSLTLTRSSR